MPSSKTTTPPEYTIWLSGTQRGTAEQLLSRIRQKAKSASIAKLSTGQYAKRLIADAPYFLPQDMHSFLEKQKYPSVYDKALRYLAEMPTSGVRILTTMETNHA